MMGNGNRGFLQDKGCSNGLLERSIKGRCIMERSTGEESRFGQMGRNMTGTLKTIRSQGMVECSLNLEDKTSKLTKPRGIQVKINKKRTHVIMLADFEMLYFMGMANSLYQTGRIMKEIGLMV